MFQDPRKLDIIFVSIFAICDHDILTFHFLI
jgi:hypothetical protein